MRELFERAIIENPNDLASYSAYADWLQEQDDPRGEFIAVQLALEDGSRPKEARDVLKAREAELLKAHEREWLGELAPFVLDAEPIYGSIRRMEARFVRGFLNELLCRSFSVNEARTLARAPETKLLGRILIESAAYEAPVGSQEQFNDSYYEPGPNVPSGIASHDTPSLHALSQVHHLAGVRAFLFGDGPTISDDEEEDHGPCRANGECVHEIIARMPRIEELYLYAHGVEAVIIFALPMPHLRVVRYDHSDSYPFEVLADNASLTNLTHLVCHPHAKRPRDPDAYIRFDQLRAICRSPHLLSLVYLQLLLTDFGDEGIEEIIASGLLKRLHVLDLALGCVTDRGAALLAACPDLKNLALLNLSQNALSAEGIALLKATGVPLQAEAQHGEHPSQIEDDGYLEYLTYGDME